MVLIPRIGTAPTKVPLLARSITAEKQPREVVPSLEKASRTIATNMGLMQASVGISNDLRT